MASPKSQALLCEICGKTTGTFTCRGCDKDFCVNHVIEHRQILSNRLDEIAQEHDELKQRLIQNTEGPRPELVEEIDKWEEESHEIIRQIALKCRKELTDANERFKNKINERLNSIAQDLRNFHENASFVETDLSACTIKLDNLKAEIIAAPTTSIKNDIYGKPVLTRPLVIETFEDFFEESNRIVTIADNTKYISHGYWASYDAFRGKGEYSSGCFQFHLKIGVQRGDSARGLSLGIISKSTRMTTSSFESTSCGWNGSNIVGGDVFSLVPVKSSPQDQEQNDESALFKFSVNDILELLINCSEKTIRLANKRTNEANEIDVDANKFPFPWQLNCAITYWNQSIRLLTTADITDINNL